MVEINSFNELICAAKAAGFKLLSFCEDDLGFWTAAWRRGSQTFKPVQRRLPFNALLDAFRWAEDYVAGEMLDDLPSAAERSEPQDDLFGA